MESTNPKHELNWIGATSFGELTTRFEYDASERVEYLGESLPGNYNAVSDNIWRIRKYIYSGSMSSPVSIIWANGTNAFSNAWESASLYDYR